METDTIQQLVTARNWLAEHALYKGDYFPHGEDTSTATAACVVGSLLITKYHLAMCSFLDAHKALTDCLPLGQKDVSVYNDLPETTKDDILALFDSAIERKQATVTATDILQQVESVVEVVAEPVVVS
jgi:hypothetical protein